MQCTLKTFPLVSSSYLSKVFWPIPAVVHWRPSRWFPFLIYLWFLPLPAVMYIDDLPAGFLLLFIYGFCLYPMQCTLKTFPLVSSSYLSKVFCPIPAVVHWRPSRWFPFLIYLWFLPLPAAMDIDDLPAGFLLLFISGFLPPTRCSTLTTFTLVSSSYISTVFAPYPL